MLIENKILLGSKSPRRRELISKICNNVSYIDIEIDETFPNSLNINEVSSYIAKKKGNKLLTLLNEDEILITADTIVVLKNEILGKPKDFHQVKEYLNLISDNVHLVHTACFIANKEKSIIFNEITEVYFNKLSIAEIEYYSNTYKPLDKAGAYGIQEWIGYIGVNKINGCFYNVMGLPISKLYNEIKNLL